MIRVLGYRVEQCIEETSRATVYRGYRESDDTPVTLTVLRTNYSRTADIAQFKHDYRLITEIGSDHVIKVYGVEEHGDGLTIIAEDFPGGDLASMLATRGRLTVEAFMDAALLLAEGITDIHRHNI